jgi:hypothetical protein|tara:strand:- start:136 stop:561 length:426 start_codon:yes stop_codon:yes gene_type:complete
MSEEKRLQTVFTYDHSKSITGIELSTAYITGLQRLCNQMIMDSDRISEMPQIFKKFELMLNIKDDQVLPEDIKFDGFESDLYTLFSMLQYFRFKAREQNLEIATETDATMEDIASLTSMIENKEDFATKLKEINDKMKVVK